MLIASVVAFCLGLLLLGWLVGFEHAMHKYRPCGACGTNSHPRRAGIGRSWHCVDDDGCNARQVLR